jgi:aspartate kinase
MKFGGSSVATIEAMKRCVQIIKETPGPQVIVISALASVTRKLMMLSYPETTTTEQKKIFAEIRAQHEAILATLKNQHIRSTLEALLAQAQKLTAQLHQHPKPQDLDALLALGEQMASLLFAEILCTEGLPAHLFDVRTVLRTNDQFGKAEPCIADVYHLCTEHLRPLLTDNAIIVTQGFIGADQEGRTTILGKESSDYTAALLAEALTAKHFKIWTDVAGVYSADPKIYEAAQAISHLSFGEALELTSFGAKVLHPRTLEPAIRKNLRCYVGSSIHPQGGTWIEANSEKTKPTIKAISLKKNQLLLRIERTYKTATLNFLENFLEILNARQIDFDLISNHGLSTTLVLDDSLAEWHHKSLCSEELLAQLRTLGKVEITKGLTLLALVGQDIPQCPKIKKILSEILQDLHIDAFYYGTSPYSLCVLTELQPEKIYPTIKYLHQQLIG